MSRLWLLGVAVSVAAASHPLHTSVTTVTQTAGSTRADVSVRVFLDDFPPGRDSAAIGAYLDRALIFTTEAGRRLALTFTAQRSEGSVLLLQAELQAPASLRGVRITNRLVVERFADQLNVVKVQSGGRATTLLFLSSDGAKEIP
ncbi:MAG: DUF6702 family protein [Gemmatimonadota bacterium]